MTKDKCWVCGHIADSEDFITADDECFCPVCGSQDIEDENENPYEDDDEEEGELY